MMNTAGKNKFDAYTDHDEISMKRFNVENTSGFF